jgi:chemosensory pili system protein ChpA (sensor histidine kinase/response regulator)
MVPPLEHMLRNRSPWHRDAGAARGARKPDGGRISISLERDGAEVVIVVADDGAGISVG